MHAHTHKYIPFANHSITHYVLSIHFANVTVNFNCFYTFSAEITNYRAYFTVGRIFNERRHFKYVQTNVNTLECCRNRGCHLQSDIQCACARHHPQHCSGGISKPHFLKKHASYIYIYLWLICICMHKWILFP